MSRFGEFLDEQMDRLKEDIRNEESENEALWNQAMTQTQSPQTDLTNSPKFQEIVAILYQDPILVQPVLNWLKQMKARIARAQLEALYSEEELEELYKSVENSEEV